MSESPHRQAHLPSTHYDSLEPIELPERESKLDRAEIEDVASHYRIPLYEDPGVVEALARLDLTATIPFELYGVIAEVLGFIYRL